jgi:hypothetical protein
MIHRRVAACGRCNKLDRSKRAATNEQNKILFDFFLPQPSLSTTSSPQVTRGPSLRLGPPRSRKTPSGGRELLSTSECEPVPEGADVAVRVMVREPLVGAADCRRLAFMMNERRRTAEPGAGIGTPFCILKFDHFLGWAEIRRVQSNSPCSVHF